MREYDPFTRARFLAFGLLVVGGLSGSLEAQSFGNGYSFQRKIDLVDAEVVGAHTNFPVLVSATMVELRTAANGGSAAP